MKHGERVAQNLQQGMKLKGDTATQAGKDLFLEEGNKVHRK